MEAQLEATNRLIDVVGQSHQLPTPKPQRKSVTAKTPDTKPVTGTDRAERWLREHPDCIDMTTREIADKVGCYPMDVTRAKKRLKT